MDDEKAIKIVEKAINDWRCLHEELNDVILYFEKTNSQAYKIVSAISNEESRLIDQASLILMPLLQNLKEIMIEKRRKK